MGYLLSFRFLRFGRANQSPIDELPYFRRNWCDFAGLHANNSQVQN